MNKSILQIIFYLFYQIIQLCFTFYLEWKKKYIYFKKIWNKYNFNIINNNKYKEKNYIYFMKKNISSLKKLPTHLAIIIDNNEIELLYNDKLMNLLYWSILLNIKYITIYNLFGILFFIINKQLIFFFKGNIYKYNLNSNILKFKNVNIIFNSYKESENNFILYDNNIQKNNNHNSSKKYIVE